MFTLVLVPILLGGSMAVLTVALQRFARPRSGARPRLIVCLGVLLLGYLAAIPMWWLAQSDLADDDDFGARIVCYLTIWVVALPAVFLFCDRRPGRTLLRWGAFGLVVLAVGLLDGFVIDEYVLVTARPFLVCDMSPTLRMHYSIQPCPKCGEEFVVTLFPKRGSDGVVRHNDNFLRLGVCSRCLYAVERAEHIGEFYGKDHYTG
jgi:hypothetical protein